MRVLFWLLSWIVVDLESLRFSQRIKSYIKYAMFCKKIYLYVSKNLDIMKRKERDVDIKIII